MQQDTKRKIIINLYMMIKPILCTKASILQALFV